MKRDGEMIVNGMRGISCGSFQAVTMPLSGNTEENDRKRWSVLTVALPSFEPGTF